MHYAVHDELAHDRWPSKRLLAVVSLLFGAEKTNFSQGKGVCLRGFTFSNFPKSLINISWYIAFFRIKVKRKHIIFCAQGPCKAGDLTVL